MVNYKDLGLVNTREMFARAIKGGYAIPAFNFNNMEQMQAIIKAAVETKSPVILQVSKGARQYANATLLRYMAQGAVEYAKELGCKHPEIVLHLDHGDTFETCKSCIDSGFSSVMIDGSHLPYEENVALTKKVVDYAHQFDVTVEGAAGLLRVFANECPSVTVRTVALEDGTSATIDRACAELVRGLTEGSVDSTEAANEGEPTETTERFESETAVAAGRLYRRYVETCDLSGDVKESAVATDSSASNEDERTPRRTLAFDVPGKLDHLYWKSDRFTAPLGENEVEIDVRATGLNFRDVMWAMGLLPEEALENGFSGPTMGLEASGVVRRTGKNVTSVKPGDAVVAFAPACFSTVVRTTEEAVAKKPSNLTFAEAASVPVAFFTSWYAIHYLGRARRGESILIHGAAGGAGLAPWPPW